MRATKRGRSLENDWLNDSVSVQSCTRLALIPSGSGSSRTVISARRKSACSSFSNGSRSGSIPSLASTALSAGSRCASIVMPRDFTATAIFRWIAALRNSSRVTALFTLPYWQMKSTSGIAREAKATLAGNATNTATLRTTDRRSIEKLGDPYDITHTSSGCADVGHLPDREPALPVFLFYPNLRTSARLRK